jgi:putative isomerase
MDTLVESHNLRDTKPPLSGWAIWEVYKKTDDIDFLAELYPQLVLYHNWWYRFRDCDGDGLCEFGSTDGTLTAAKWESGMDNAIRFDGAHIVEGSNYSINSESVDLNSYLAKEKEYLFKMAQVLDLPDALHWRDEANVLKERIRSTFFDSELGYFFDIDYETGEYLNSAMGPEGWTPLWCGIASEEQAAAVVGNMMDSQKFNTYVPLPTIDVSHESFDPEDGYWRGPVWIDQVWLGYVGLKKYGFHEEAEMIRQNILRHCEGLSDMGSPIRENYHPLTGKGLNAEHFSWSAAHLILMQP